MARKQDPEHEAVPPTVAARRPFPPGVDPRFQFTCLVTPLRVVTSAAAGWDGALLVDADTGPVRLGEVRHDHTALAIQHWLTPNRARRIGGAGRWTTHAPGVRLALPGDREHGEWTGHNRAPFLFVAPERIEAVLGRPWDRSGLTRWRAVRHQLPFVEHVVSALTHDVHAGSPAGPITGDALVVALLLHLDGRGAAARPARPGALGGRLEVVRDYIEDHLARPLRLEELAAVAGVEVRRFGPLFAAATGCSLQRHVVLRRIERAKRLARDPELTLAQVARAVGFAGEDQLARAFSQYAGEQPGAHRRH